MMYDYDVETSTERVCPTVDHCCIETYVLYSVAMHRAAIRKTPPLPVTNTMVSEMNLFHQGDHLGRDTRML
jgi:hypothetical protein